MSSHGPLVRGRHLKLLLESAERQVHSAAVLERLDVGSLGAIREASGLDWLPLEHDLALTRALYEGLGAAAAGRFFRAHTLGSFDGPVLRTMVHTAVRLFGLEPGAWARWVPKGWQLLFRGCGDWTVGEAGPGRVTLTLSAMPPACAEDPAWLRSVGSSLEALLDLARVRGVVELAPREAGAAEATFALRWSARGIGDASDQQRQQQQ
jgi:hypothetical protein